MCQSCYHIAWVENKHIQHTYNYTPYCSAVTLYPHVSALDSFGWEKKIQEWYPVPFLNLSSGFWEKGEEVNERNGLVNEMFLKLF